MKSPGYFPGYSLPDFSPSRHSTKYRPPGFPGHVSIVSSPFLANSKPPLVPHLLEVPDKPSSSKRNSKPKRKVIINIINSDEAQNNNTLEDILNLSRNKEQNTENKGINGVIQPLSELNGMEVMKFSNRYKRSSDKDNGTDSNPDSMDDTVERSSSDPPLDQILSFSKRKSHSKRKVVINIINGGEGTLNRDTEDDNIDKRTEEQEVDDTEDSSFQSADEVSDSLFLPKFSDGKRRKVVINIINGADDTKSNATGETIDKEQGEDEVKSDKQQTANITNIEESSTQVLDTVNGSQRSSLADYDALYFSPPDGEFPSVLDLGSFNYEYEQEYEEDQLPVVSPVDPSQLLIGFGGSQSTTRIPFVRKPVRNQNLQNMGNYQVE